MIVSSALSWDRLCEVLDYDPLTGIFKWRKATKKVKVGDIAGCESGGYIRITIDGLGHGAHQLAWFYHYGEQPKLQIDHRNGVGIDNWISNLRDVSNRVNNENQRMAHSRSKTGLLGASPLGHRFMGSIQVKGARHYLGLFDSAEEAHEAYLTAKRLLHEGCTI